MFEWAVNFAIRYIFCFVFALKKIYSSNNISLAHLGVLCKIAMKIGRFIIYYPNKSDNPAQSETAVVAPRTLPAHVCNDVKSAVGVSKPLTVVVYIIV